MSAYSYNNYANDVVTWSSSLLWSSIAHSGLGFVYSARLNVVKVHSLVIRDHVIINNFSFHVWLRPFRVLIQAGQSGAPLRSGAACSAFGGRNPSNCRASVILASVQI